MRATLLLPVACLALLAGPAAAQQAAPAPTPPAPQPGPAETAPAPAPQQGMGMPHGMGQGMGMGMPHEMGRGMWEGGHGHAGLFQAPGLRIRVGGVSLDLRCAVGDTSEACAKTALGIIDHLAQMSPGGGTGQDENGGQDNGDGDNGGGDQ